MSSLTRVSAGDSILENMRASTWNFFIDGATEALKNKPPKGSERDLTAQPGGVSVYVQNTTNANRDKGEVLGLDGPLILDTENEAEFFYRPVWKGIAPVAASYGNFVVLAEPIRAGAIGRAFGAGQARVRLERTLGGLRRADIQATIANRLVATPNGTAQIKWFANGLNGTGTGWAIVQLGEPQFVVVRAVTFSTIAVGSTDAEVHLQIGTTASTYSITGVALDWMHGGQQISSGKQVLVGWFPDEKKWRIISAECEA